MGAMKTLDMLVDEHRRRFDASFDASGDESTVWSRLLKANERRTGLALSGGGVRSATFGLGVLEGLARRGLLSSIDYLSTVSGGGFIGAWLTTWAHRHPGGIDGVARELGALRELDAGEARPVQHLRCYSNYLTPRTGVFSTDTWTILGTFLRNLLVNWLTLIPYFLLALLVPMAGLELLHALVARALPLSAARGVALPDVLLAAGLVCLVAAILVMSASIPTGRQRSVDAGERLVAEGQGQFLGKVLAPLTAGAVMLAAWWAWFENARAGIGMLLAERSQLLPLWGRFALLGMLAHLAAWGVYTYRTRRYKLGTGRQSLAGRESGRGVELLAVLVSGATGGWILWLLATKTVPAMERLSDKLLAVYLAASVPAFLLGFLLAATLYVALASPRMEDEDREWFARAGAWILVVAVGWAAVATVALLGPAILEWAWKRFGAWTVSAGGLSGVVSLWLGRSARTGASSAKQAAASVGLAGWGDLAAEWGLTLAAPIFVIVLALLGASGLQSTQRLLASAWSLPPGGAVAVLAGVLAVVMLLFAFVVNVNVFSLHGMYRDRLIRAYLGASRRARKPNRFTGFDPDDNVALAHLVSPFFNAHDWPLVHAIASALQSPQHENARRVVDEADETLIGDTVGINRWDAEDDTAVHSILSRFNYVLSAAREPVAVRRQWEQIVKTGRNAEFGSDEWWSLVAIARELHPDRDRLDREPDAALRRKLLQESLVRHDPGWIAETIAVSGWDAARAKELAGRLNAVLAAAVPVSPGLGAAPVPGGAWPADTAQFRAMLDELVPTFRPAPLHIVNATINLVAGEDLAWQERQAASFTFTPYHAGSERVHYRRMAAGPDQPRAYGGPGGVSLGTAVTISGAAANPNMGYHSSPVVTLLLTLFNARLGAWLANPADDDRFRDSYPRRGVPMALAEAFGMTHDKGRYVNLSDGGHFENLGLYELVRRGCGRIIVVDAGCDPTCAFEDLGNAVRKIRVDLGVEITFDGFEIGPKPGGSGGGQHVAVGRIHYRIGQDGTLLYVKPLRGAKREPIDVVQYETAHRDFPHESTADQWFSESQFESYRALGEQVVLDLLRDNAAQLPEPVTKLVCQWKGSRITKASSPDHADERG